MFGIPGRAISSALGGLFGSRGRTTAAPVNLEGNGTLGGGYGLIGDRSGAPEGLMETLLDRYKEPISTNMPVEDDQMRSGPLGGAERSDTQNPGDQYMPEQANPSFNRIAQSQPSTSAHIPPAWQRWQTGQRMQDAYANNWSPNPTLIRMMGGVGRASAAQPSDLYNPTTNPSGQTLPPGRWGNLFDSRKRY